MFSFDFGDDVSEERSERRDGYRVRRAKPSRRRMSKPSKINKVQEAPGGIRQRRNKHWNW